MKESRKKLPLPPRLPSGSASGRRAKKTAVIAAAAILLGALVAAGLLLTRAGTISSSRAFFSGSLLEIRVNIDGVIAQAAVPGQPVTAGETVLSLDSSQYAQEAQEAESVVNARAGSIPQRSRNLMLRYLAITQSEAELAEAVNAAQAAEKSSREAQAALARRQALFSLELRKLELKRQRLPEEEERMEAMRIEETLLRKSSRESLAEYESASLARAALERQLQAKLDLGRALRALPAEQREQLYALETEFQRIYEAERQIALATVQTPKSGRVLYAELSSGAAARAGDTALYILPDGDSLWVTAYFSPAAAAKIELGAPCSITFSLAAAPVTLQGTVSERLPYLEGDPPFKVTLQNPDLTSLSGLNPRQAVEVRLDK